jgi:hypothetical protein
MVLVPILKESIIPQVWRRINNMKNTSCIKYFFWLVVLSFPYGIASEAKPSTCVNECPYVAVFGSKGVGLHFADLGVFHYCEFEKNIRCDSNAVKASQKTLAFTSDSLIRKTWCIVASTSNDSLVKVWVEAMKKGKMLDAYVIDSSSSPDKENEKILRRKNAPILINHFKNELDSVLGGNKKEE